ncbi:cytidine deaminase [Bacillus solimangrovi]|uniref:Cytidine deaminase n=1 Tax=Bacillus solimangrovi TaxID=1305675 RepID=A0A1E5LKD3_9BACI|nr:cytidine deaminase [Bacillus solimangrovi]OEH94535.1 cytidine deaminase [Bacillus solimangrovi]
MKLIELTEQDYELVREAQAVITKYYELGRHHIGAALRTKCGEIFTAVHLEANVGRVSVCAEAIVIGKAISEGYNEFASIVAVRHPDRDEENQEIRVVAPCGICRELLSDYETDISILIPHEQTLKKVYVNELLPLKYSRTSS